MRYLALVMLAALILSACEDDSGLAPVKQSQSERAKAAAESIRFTENAEIDNIKKRLELTADPGLLGYVALINSIGQIVLYTPVEGKITSGGKRLTSPQRFVEGDTGQWYGDFVMDAPSDEGTWGHSNPYVYFWTPAGQYIQTDMEYVYSDQPFRLSEEPLLIAGEAQVEPPLPAH